MRISFRAKTVLGIAIIEATFLSLLIVNSLRILSTSHENELQYRAQTLADVFSSAVSDSVLSLDIATLTSLVEDLLENPEVRKVEVANTEEVLLGKPSAIEHVYIDSSVEANADIEVGNAVFGSVRLWVDATYVQDVVSRARNQSIRIALIEILLVGIASVALGWYLTNQLKRLQQEIEAVRNGDLRPTINEKPFSNDEIGDTMAAFSRLRRALWESTESQQTMLGQVSQLAEDNRQKEAWLKIVINQLVDGVVAFDPQGTIHYVNEPAMDMLGYSDHPMIGLSVFDLPLTNVQKERLETFIHHGPVHGSRETLTRHSDEMMYRKNGEAFSSSVSLSHVNIDTIDYFVLTLSQSAWQQQVEKQMLMGDAIRTGILESSISAVVAIDQYDSIIEFNPSAEEMFGYLRQEVLGQTLSELIMPERFRQAHQMGMKHYLKTGEGPVLRKRIEILAIDRNHREFPIELAITPIETKEGIIFTAVIDDISQRLDDTKRLELAKDDADRANREKSRFLASMSHEIRTPLNVMLGMVDLVQGTPLTDQQKSFLVSAENAGRNLLDMINDVLDLSKIEAGKMEVNASYFDPVAVFEETVLLFRQRCWSKKLRLYTFIGNTIPDKVFLDVSFYRQIISNLVANAVNYTERGQIVAKLYIKRINGLQHLCVDVEDSGPGLTESQQLKLFEEFSQVQQSTPKQTKGTGLGLVICRELANLVGGDISLRSKVNHGSTFSLQVPLVTERLSQPSSIFEHQHCHLVSGDQIWIDQLEHQLLAWGITITSSANLVDLAKKSFDVVIIDCGYFWSKVRGVSNELQALGDIESPVILSVEDNVTSTTTLKQVAASLQQPTTSVRLSQSLVEALSDTSSDVLPTKSNDSPSSDLTEYLNLKNANVLLVEDSEANRVIASTYLSESACRVIEATDGIEAIEHLREETVDVILMDMRMPRMGGVEATRIIREEKLAERVPIIALTAHAMVEVRDECLAVGMQDFLTKPIDKATLLGTLNRWLGNRIPVKENEEFVKDISVKDEEEVLFDGNVVNQLIEDTSMEATTNMLNVFFNECDRRLSLIEEAQKNSSLDDFEVSVHALKSSAKTFGALKLSSVAKAAEEACHSGNEALAFQHAAQISELTVQTKDEMARALSSWWQPL